MREQEPSLSRLSPEEHTQSQFIGAVCASLKDACETFIDSDLSQGTLPETLHNLKL